MRDDGLPKETWSSYRINQRVPESFQPAACTMIITWRETLSYSRRVGVGAGSRVLVLGSGGTALAFMAHARNLEAAVIACVGSISRELPARKAGASHFHSYRDDELADSIRRDTPEFDFIIDSVGKAAQIDRVLPLLKPGGMLAIYGLDDFDAIRINPFVARGTFSVYGGGYDEEETHQEVMRRMADGSLNAAIWLDLDHPFDLKDIAGAIDAVRSRRQIKALVRLCAD
jgi:D-arabinose 1-dehydrogenase-like Zn-dependent alcohol dehydrogenase